MRELGDSEKSEEENEKHPWSQHTELPLALTRLGILKGRPGLGLSGVSPPSVLWSSQVLVWVTAEQAQEVRTGGTCLEGALDQGLAAPCRPRVGERRRGPFSPNPEASPAFMRNLLNGMPPRQASTSPGLC